ncbi:MAG: hypothetical protein AUI83_20525 [Armatimonadetes bacterium 13_1_40CM_3_65_7]|nr:MAG: hypothetical protein AUI83_20525 [Armatimonadetes bacterium 13_1_40CM_3_65_7]
MSMKYLGDTLDIHCGGIDHVPVHHTNEIAQSEAATGHKFVRYWLHNAFLIFADNKSDNGSDDGQEVGAAVKMSKSGDNFITLQRILDRGFDPMAYRYLCLQAHYRSELKFNWDTLEAAQSGLRKVYGVRAEKDPLSDDTRFSDARAEALEYLNDDLNTPQLVGILNRHSSYRLWTEFDAVLGLGIAARAKEINEDIPPDVQSLVDKRNAARQAKEWAQSDEIRTELIRLGWEVGDGPTGTTVKRRAL